MTSNSPTNRAFSAIAALLGLGACGGAVNNTLGFADLDATTFGDAAITADATLDASARDVAVVDVRTADVRTADVVFADTVVPADVHVVDVVSTVDVPPTDTGPSTGPVPSDPSLRTRDQVCARWTADRRLRATRTWVQGTAGACDPGTLDPEARADGFRVLNVYRWLSGLDASAVDPSLTAAQQQCALMEGVNGALNHMPPATWRCYTAAGAAQAGRSNLAAGTRMNPAAAVDLWVNEPAQELGHARWCLAPPLGPTDFGSTDTTTSMNSFAATASATRPAWVAYPNQGVAPFENAQGVWHVQDGTVSVAGRTVEMRDEATGAVLATTPVSTTGNYGNSAAVAWRPSGWTPSAGTVYRVTLRGGTGPAISYTVTPVRCP